MWKIFEKKEDNSQEGRIKKLEKRVFQLESDVLDALTSIDIIRNKVLKKIKLKKDDIVEEEQHYMTDLLPKSQDLNNSIGIVR